MRVFVDASAFIAILVETDSNHKRAAEIAARLELEKAELITSSMVVAEVLTVLSMRFSKILALTFGERVMRGDGLAIIHPSALTFEHTWELWKNEKDKDVSFVDAVSFTVIESEKDTLAFSFDHHFHKRTFKVLS